MTYTWTPPSTPPPEPAAPTPPRRRLGVLVGTALVGGGAVVGAIIGATALSGAATPTPSPSASTSTAAPGTSESGGRHGGGLNLSGTVTAVGSTTVTIKTSTGTTVYQVDANSDIDKNGESTLSQLVVGDAVMFSVDSSSPTTIDKLHTGTESLNRPTGG